MKKIFKTLLIFVSVTILSGCGILNMVIEQDKENQKDVENWLHERSEKSKDSTNNNN
ncbi:hypothetical protein P4604_16800 [Lysinibacillus capsici]|uniref:hypothetical protein n=1 Tax=Lysinibacillus capsici TaxID=2115968 RepID=UPI002E1C0C0E|nr:hypothetical protein [Lysinibacillus capsici]